MENFSLNPTVELEHKLKTFYQKLNKKEVSIARKIKRSNIVKESGKPSHALYLHFALNFITIAGLFFLLY